MLKTLRRILPAVALGVLIACGNHGRQPSTSRLTPGTWPDTLRVATLYSPTSFFMYRDDEMGYDYTLVKRLADDKGMVLDLNIATSLADAIEMLDSGKVDLIAYEVPIIAEYRDHAAYCGPQNETTQVLVQPRKSAERITDVTQLVGRDIYVEADSKYHHRIENLNAELGGGINIHSIDRDTLMAEDLIEMVSTGEIALTVVDSDIARINKTYYPDLDITLPVSFAQRSAWAVAPVNQWLADSVNAWLTTEPSRRQNAMLLKRYFELSKRIPSIYTIDLSHGRISPYDDLFRGAQMPELWDWRMLASQAFIESRFNSDVVSWAGARGIMQIMPSTARAYHVKPETLIDPKTSIDLSCRILTALENAFAGKVADPKERVKFILAAYNSGVAHIYDAMRIAEYIGKDPQVWDGNVAEALLLKSNPEFYNNADLCKFGYFRGRQTTTYVREVMQVYDRCLKAGL